MGFVGGFERWRRRARSGRPPFSRSLPAHLPLLPGPFCHPPSPRSLLPHLTHFCTRCSTCSWSWGGSACTRPAYSQTQFHFGFVPQQRVGSALKSESGQDEVPLLLGWALQCPYGERASPAGPVAASFGGKIPLASGLNCTSDLLCLI